MNPTFAVLACAAALAAQDPTAPPAAPDANALGDARLTKALRKQVFAKEALRALQEPMIIGFLALGLYVAMIYFQLSLASVTVLVFLLARLMSQMGRVQRAMRRCFSRKTAAEEASTYGTGTKTRRITPSSWTSPPQTRVAKA